MLGLKKKVEENVLLTYDVTIFQTPMYGQKRGYKQVYRLIIEGTDHSDVITQTFRMFNVQDLLPHYYYGRFIGTGDILLIEEGGGRKSYYRLSVGGWVKINRVHVM